MTDQNQSPTQITDYDFGSTVDVGLLICAGGFEDRSLAFVRRLNRTRCNFEAVCLMEYRSQEEDNHSNFQSLLDLGQAKIGQVPELIQVDANSPVQACTNIKHKVEQIACRVSRKSAFVDISGMTHLWALASIHTCLSQGFDTSIIYTEARDYYPKPREQKKVITAWRNRDYDIAAEYLQSAGLKAIYVHPEFSGNLRPTRKICLIIFAGYEPNRIEAMVDQYGPGALIILYGVSPHERLVPRVRFSRELHADLFPKWLVREDEVSTLDVGNILGVLAKEFEMVQNHYDIAIAPQCSKMQGVASYLFWREHPEIQLIFTFPVRFRPERYSYGAGRTFVYNLGEIRKLGVDPNTLI